MADTYKIAAPHIGTTEYKEKSDSIPVDLLPSNRMIYMTKLNSREEREPELTRCKNLKEVFANFRPSQEVTVNKQDGSEQSVELEFNAMKDFGSMELIQRIDYLKEKYSEVEILRNFKNLLEKANSKLKKDLSIPQKREEFLKVLNSYIAQL